MLGAMEPSLGDAALIATVVAPVVASLVFVGTVVYDRWHRRREQLGSAVSQALSSLTKAAKWSMWPYPVAVLGTWQVDVLTDLAAVAIQLPRRRSAALAVWLVNGAIRVGKEVESQNRIHAISQLVTVGIQIQAPSRRALREAQKYCLAHPWPEEVPEMPPQYRVLSKIGLWPLRLLTGDISYGRRADA